VSQSENKTSVSELLEIHLNTTWIALKDQDLVQMAVDWIYLDRSVNKADDLKEV